MQHTRAAMAAAIAALFCNAAHAAENEQELKPVVVTATRTVEPVSKVLADTTVVTREDVSNAAGSSLAEVLSTQPGIEMARTGGPGTTTDIFVRGTRTAQTAVLVDGLRLINPSNGGGMLEFLPLGMVDRVEIVRGPMSGLYGSGAIGGAIQIFTRDNEDAPKAHFSAGAGSYRSYQTAAGYGGRVGDTGFYVGGSADGARGFSASRPTAGTSTYSPDEDGNKRVAGTLRLSQQLAAGQKISVSALQASGDTDVDTGSTPGAYQRQFVRALSFRTDNRITDFWRSDLTVGKTTLNYEYVNAGFTFAPKTGNAQGTWLNEFSLPVGKLLAGFERQHQTIFGQGVDYLRHERTIRSAFGQYSAELGAHSGLLNVRHDRWSDFGSVNTGNIGYGYRLADAWQVGGSVGKAFRAPTFDDLFFPCQSFGCSSNPNLRPERSRNREGWVRFATGRHSASLTVFHNRIHDAIELDSNFIPQNVEARIVGATLTGETHLGGVKLQASLTGQSPKDETTGNQLARRAKHIGSVLVEDAFGPVTIGTQVQAQSTRYDTRDNTGAKRMGGYALINAYANYRVSTDWSAFLRVGNLADRRYETAQNYNTAELNAFFGVRYEPK